MARAFGPGEREAAFWARTERQPYGDCWLWLGCRHKRTGYGEVLWVGRRKRQAHRVAAFLSGLIPGLDTPKVRKGFAGHVLHTCDVRLCCNPAHLFAGTQTENMKDARLKGRFTRAKLTAAQVVECRALWAAGLNKTKLAARFGVSRASIRNLIHGRTYGHA